MKRFGKLITLVLVVAMALSLMSVAALAASSSDYKDVVAGKWYVQYVDWALKNEFMTGISDTEWAPNTATTRGMVIQTLYKMAGAPEVEGDSPFADVAEGKYYTDAVKWAAKVGVASGKSADSFKPDDVLTRQEAATFFCAFAKNVWKLDVTDVSGMNKFPDNADVANYAKDAMGWAVKANVISGSKENDKVLLMPKRDITRAELAAMLKALKALEPKPDDPTPVPAVETADVQFVLTTEAEKDDISGVRFVFTGYDKNGNWVERFATTDKNGVAKFKNVVATGDKPYYIHEEGWYGSYENDTYVPGKLDKFGFVDIYDEGYAFQVSSDPTVVEIKHEFAKELVLVNVTTEDVKSTLEGLQVKLTGKSYKGEDVSTVVTTNKDGKAFFNVPRSDKNGYTAEVINIGEQYKTPAPAKKIAAPQTKSAQIDIKLKRATFKAKLVDKDGKAIKLAGVKLVLTGKLASGAAAPQINAETDVNGVAIFSNVPFSNEDGYTLSVTENEAIKNYDYDSQIVKIASEKIDDVDVVLTAQTKGIINVKVVNVDEDNAPVAGIKVKLSGTKFKGTTGADGIAAIKNIDAAAKGAYSLELVDLPSYYTYENAAEVAKAMSKIKVENKKSYDVTVKLSYTTGTIDVTFVDADSGKPVEDAQLQVTGLADMGEELYYQTQKSNAQGKASGIDAKLRIGFLNQFKVIAVPAGYLTTDYTVTVNGNVVPANGIAAINASPANVIVVELKKAPEKIGTVKVTVKAGDRTIDDAAVVLTDKNKAKSSAGSVKDGVYTFEGLKVGDYTISVSDKYVINTEQTETTTVKVADEKVVEVTVYVDYKDKSTDRELQE